MKQFQKITLILLSAFFIASCSSDEGNMRYNDLTLKFDQVVGNEDLVLDTKMYTNSKGNEYKINNFRYIVSDIQLKGDNGLMADLSDDANTFIVDERKANADGTFHVNLSKVPSGTYNSLEFGVGITQDRYMRGADGQGDFLNQADESSMYWKWAAGYIFIRMDGKFISKKTNEEDSFNFHMGSHGDVSKTGVNNYRTIRVNLKQPFIVKDNSQSITLNCDLGKLFDGLQYQHDLEEKNSVMISAKYSPLLTNNFSSCFSEK